MGAELLTLIRTFALFEVCVPSLAVKTNDVVPTKPGVGVKVRFGAVPESVPFAGVVLL